VPESWFVYLLECKDGSYYVGVARDVAKRVELHNAGRGARYTRGRGPVRVLAKSPPLGKEAAHKVEYWLKQHAREEKLAALRSLKRSKTRVALLALLAACSAPSPSPSPVPTQAPAAVAARHPADAARHPADAAIVEPHAPAPDAARGAPDDLVDLATLAPDIKLDLRYATADNFTGRVMYPAARCLLRRAVAERLVRVQARLAAAGKGLALWDCYRPFAVQEAFWKAVPDARYVAKPIRKDGAPASGSKHNRGAAVDATLVDAGGGALELPTDFDAFGPSAHRGDPSWSPAARAHADELEAAMVAEGFEPLPTEWWHFDAPGWREFPLGDQPLDDVR
jgi:beta-N-acetylhexosaminidase/D-alanyl-D-alanine dipeptidase